MNTSNTHNQHKGIGKKLIKIAEFLCYDIGLEGISVISGIGVVGYYKNLGYSKEDSYLVKYFDDTYIDEYIQCSEFEEELYEIHSIVTENSLYYILNNTSQHTLTPNTSNVRLHIQDEKIEETTYMNEKENTIQQRINSTLHETKPLQTQENKEMEESQYDSIEIVFISSILCLLSLCIYYIYSVYTIYENQYYV